MLTEENRDAFALSKKIHYPRCKPTYSWSWLPWVQRRCWVRHKKALLLADEEDFTIIKFVDEQVDVTYEIDEKHKKCVMYEGKQKSTCLMLSKASCGTATTTLLWYKLLNETLIKDGFKLNPYILFFSNKMVDRKQCTIMHHGDGTNILCMSPLVLEHINQTRKKSLFQQR